MVNLGKMELYAQLWREQCALEGKFTYNRVAWPHSEAEPVSKCIRIPALVYGCSTPDEIVIETVPWRVPWGRRHFAMEGTGPGAARIN